MTLFFLVLFRVEGGFEAGGGERGGAGKIFRDPSEVRGLRLRVCILPRILIYIFSFERFKNFFLHA